jgi:adenine-specific DNA-methyltransferase
MKRLDGKSLDIVSENVTKLKEIFPEVFCEGRVDFEKLQESLGEFVENKSERYNFTWHGKQNAKKIAQTPSTGTLRPSYEDSKNWDSTQNLYIEGDNLEVLKLLQKSYHKKVKMIYIDPPYNTGKDFVYKDNFKENIKNYLELTGQVDSEGNRLSTNSETNGRYHSDWLNMMYPRLKLARNLLKDDGVIFISIDDNEVANLRKICDEIFGEDNFVAQYIHKNNSSKNQATLVSVSTEYFYCYAKNKGLLKENQWRLKKKGAADIAKLFKRLQNNGLSLEEIELEIKEMYKRPKYAHLSRWNKVDDRGVFVDADLSREGGAKNYTIINPNTGIPCLIPNRGWGKSEEELIRLQDADLIWYGSNETPPRVKEYINPDDVSVPDSFWYYDNSVDTRWIKNEFGQLIFENPKPLEMVKSMIEMVGIESSDVVLDFFSGSATTAHAIMQLNAEDKGNRKYILVQLPEPTDEKSEAYKAGYKNICEIGKERIRRAGERILNDKCSMMNEEKNSKLNTQNSSLDLDIGFKVFKLDSSNIKEWDSDFDNLEQNLLDAVDNIKENRTSEDLLYEILLKYGLDLTLPIEERVIENKKVFVIGYGALIVCLDDEITTDVVEQIAKLKDEYQSEVMRVVFKDGSFKDAVVKTNALQILKQFGIDEVVSV